MPLDLHGHLWKMEALGMATWCWLGRAPTGVRKSESVTQPMLTGSLPRPHPSRGFFHAQPPDRDRYGLTVPDVTKAAALMTPAQSALVWGPTRTGKTVKTARMSES